MLHGELNVVGGAMCWEWGKRSRGRMLFQCGLIESIRAAVSKELARCQSKILSWMAH
jgi:hypothetical protein